MIIDLLNKSFEEINVDYNICPLYYDLLQTTFYKSNLLIACQHFDALDVGKQILSKIDWSKILTDKYTVCNYSDPGSIGKELVNTKNFIKDNYYSITKCLYDNRNQIKGNEKLIENWLISKSRYRLKPFFMLNLIGIQVEYLNNNKNNFFTALGELEKVDWNRI